MGSGFAKAKKEKKAMQQQWQQMQEQLNHIEVTGSAGKMVHITLNGKHEMKKISIDPSCIDPQDNTTLEDLIIVSYNDALKKLQEHSSSMFPF